jgi:Holliday junction resolvase YEN1
MFGCDFLIRDDRVAKQAGVTDRSKENTRKDAKSIRVVRASEIREAHGLDRDGLVLFAMLKGGDYDTKGLPGCGEAATMRAVKAGLGRSLCNCRTKADCMAWRENLVSFFSRSRSIVVPPNFPEIKTLNKYNKPTVSTDEELLNLRGLRGGWDRPIKELKLLEVTSSRFNIWGRLYLNWIAPILLTRYLTTNDPLVNAGNPHMIKLMKSRVKEDETPLERKLTFSPFGLTTLRRGDLEGGERQGYWDGARDVPFDPNHRVQCEIADYFLQKALPKEIMSPPMASRKRQRQDEDQPESSTSDRTRRHERRVDATPSASAKRANSGSRAHIIDLVGYDPECDSDSDKDILTPLNFGSFIGPQDRRVRQISDRHHVHSISTSVSGGSASILIEDDDEGDSAFQEAIRRSMEDVTPCGKSSAGADRVNGQLSHLLSVRSNRAGCSPAARKPKISSANTPTTPILSQPSPLRGYSNVSDSSGPQKDKGIVPSLCGLGSQETKDNENLQRGSSSLADTPSRKAHIRNLDNLDSAGITATPRSIEEIREARVRRFTKQTSTTCEQISVEASTMQGPASTVRESAAIECIDLTSD